ncbi:ParB N-terminal domain-containing protein [Brevibacillus daliensis]|uniref:ParB N-terminal domain-containing protein n=1 Tax=Brevibacillus daliensis TaxID=2892995 RepID=UPI001E29C365|nr:ParB N-terminal domain-containing protein [Brevibacillus daliensis]
MLVQIDKIKVSDRIRKDFGNIEELAHDIDTNGLINPPVVTPDLALIAGERRLRACKHLGWQQIEVRVMTVRDYEHQLRMEISENENRKEFTFSERIDWARRLEQVERVKAKERMSEGGKGRQNIGNLRTDDVVAEESGFGNRENYRKAKFITDHANPEVIAKLDTEEISIHAAYQETKRKLAEAERVASEATAETHRLQSELDDARAQMTVEPEVVERIIEKPVEIIREVVPEELSERLHQLSERETHYKRQLEGERTRLAKYESYIAELTAELEKFRTTSQYDSLSVKAASFVDRQLEITGECNSLAEKIVVMTLEVPDDIPQFVREIYRRSFRTLSDVCAKAFETMTPEIRVYDPESKVIEIKGDVVNE